MAQRDLFDVGERLPIHVKGTPCTAAPIGTGPEGETCRTCKHLARIRYHDKNYLKCGLMEHHWTHGPGSDIRAKYAACREWKAED